MTSGHLLSLAPVASHELPTGGCRARTIHRRQSRKGAAAGAIGLGLAVLAASLAAGGNTVTLWLGWSLVHAAFAAVLSLAGIVAIRRLDQPSAAILALGCAFVGVALIQALPLALPALRNFAGGWPAVAPGSALVAAVRAAGVLALFCSAYCLIRCGASDTAVLRVIVFGIAGHSIWALHLLSQGDGAGPAVYAAMATGGFVNKNALATFLGIGLVAGVALATRPTGRRRDLRSFAEALALGIALAAIVAGLAATGSRLGITATVLSLPLALPAGRRHRTLWLGAPVLALVLVRAGPADLGAIAADLRTRFDLYGQILGMIATRPLSGFGLDAFPLAFERFHRPPVTAAFTWDHAHSTYLTLWSEAGLIAGSLPMVAGLIAAWRLRSSGAGSRHAPTASRAALAALILVAIHALGDFTIEMLANLQLMTLLVAIGLARAAAGGRKAGPV